MKLGHTGRGDSGALYLQSAVAGVMSSSEGGICVACAVCFRVEEWVPRNYRL